MRGNRTRSHGEIGDTSTSLMDILGNSLGAVLFLLILVMVVMILLPKAMATLYGVRILPGDVESSSAVVLPEATIGEPYRFLFATEGGNEFVSLERVEGQFPSGLDWLTTTHGDAGVPREAPGYETRIGIEGVPTGPSSEHEFVLQAHSRVPTDREEAERWKQADYEVYKSSSPKRFHLRVVSPAVKRLDEIQDLQIVSPEELPPVRLSPQGTVNCQLAAKGGVRPYRWSVQTYPNLRSQVSEDGLFTAHLTEPVILKLETSVESAEAALLVRAGRQASAIKALQLRILPPESELTITTPDTLQPAVVGEEYVTALSAVGGTGNYLWSLLPEESAEAPPSWLVLDESFIKASPNMAAVSKEPHAFRVAVSDGRPDRQPAVKTLRLPVAAPALVTADPQDPASQLKITTKEQLPAALARNVYRLMFAAQGGRPPYHWKIIEWSYRQSPSNDWLPKRGIEIGLLLDAEGWLHGVPLVWGQIQLRLQVRDSDSTGQPGTRSADKDFQLLVAPPPNEAPVEPLRIVTPSQLPDARTGVRYQMAFSGTGGVPPYEWKVDGRIPDGLKLATLGVFEGTPAAESAESYSFVVLLQDQSGGDPATNRFSLRLRPGVRPLRVVTTTLPMAALGRPYEAPLVEEGGEPPFVWSITRGTLPPGLKLEDTGLIRGTSSEITEKPIIFAVRVSQQDGSSAAADVQISVAAMIEPSPLRIVTDEGLPPATVGLRYSFQFVAEGGVAPYSWKQGERWPGPTAGLVRLSESGRLENPQFPSAKTHLLAVTVMDAVGAKAAKQFTVQVRDSQPDVLKSPDKLTIVTPPNLPPALVGSRYELALAANGGAPPYQWALKGNLPEELSFKDGQIRGRPRRPLEKPVVFTLMVQDAQAPPDTAERQCELRLVAATVQSKMREDWWKYFGFAGLLVAYLFFKQTLNDRHFFSRRQHLTERGLIILIKRGGVYIDGPDDVRREHSELVKADTMRVRMIRMCGLLSAGLYSYYLFGL